MHFAKKISFARQDVEKMQLKHRLSANHTLYTKSAQIARPRSKTSRFHRIFDGCNLIRALHDLDLSGFTLDQAQFLPKLCQTFYKPRANHELGAYAWWVLDEDDLERKVCSEFG